MLEAIKQEVHDHLYNHKLAKSKKKVTLAEYKKNNRVSMVGIEEHIKVSADIDSDQFEKLASHQMPTDIDE